MMMYKRSDRSQKKVDVFLEKGAGQVKPRTSLDTPSEWGCMKVLLTLLSGGSEAGIW